MASAQRLNKASILSALAASQPGQLPQSVCAASDVDQYLLSKKALNTLTPEQALYIQFPDNASHLRFQHGLAVTTNSRNSSSVRVSKCITYDSYPGADSFPHALQAALTGMQQTLGVVCAIGCGPTHEMKHVYDTLLQQQHATHYMGIDIEPRYQANNQESSQRYLTHHAVKPHQLTASFHTLDCTDKAQLDALFATQGTPNFIYMRHLLVNGLNCTLPTKILAACSKQLTPGCRILITLYFSSEFEFMTSTEMCYFYARHDLNMIVAQKTPFDAIQIHETLSVRPDHFMIVLEKVKTDSM